jgi:hypothetical protein
VSRSIIGGHVPTTVPQRSRSLLLVAVLTAMLSLAVQQ